MAFMVDAGALLWRVAVDFGMQLLTTVILGLTGIE